MTPTTMNGPRGEFDFIFIWQDHNVGIYSFRRVKYVVCSLAKVVLNLTLIDSLTVSPFSYGEKYTDRRSDARG